jgi:hypothetical protein
MPRGAEYRISLAELLQASREHQAGWSLRALARMRYREWGYASPGSALEGLRHALRTIDAPVRARALAHRRALRARQRAGLCGWPNGTHDGIPHHEAL